MKTIKLDILITWVIILTPGTIFFTCIAYQIIKL